MMDDEEDTRVNQMLSRKGTQVENFKKVVNLYTKPAPINTKPRGASPHMKKEINTANIAYRRLSSDHNIMQGQAHRLISNDDLQRMISPPPHALKKLSNASIHHPSIA